MLIREKRDILASSSGDAHNGTDEQNSRESLYEYIQIGSRRAQLCPVCKTIMSDLPGTRDAICHTCGFKDPCCE